MEGLMYKNKTDTDNDVTVMHVYGVGLVVLPRLTVCDEYRVPMNHVHATNFIKKHLGLDIVIPANLRRAILISSNGSTSIAQALRTSWRVNIKDATKYPTVSKDTAFEYIKEKFNHYGIASLLK